MNDHEHGDPRNEPHPDEASGQSDAYESNPWENDPMPGEPALPPLPMRFVSVFFSPGRLMEQLAAKPAWAAAGIVAALIIGVSVALIPTEIMLETQRQAAMERGVEMQEMPEAAVQAMRIVAPIASTVFSLLFMVVFSFVYTVIFAFVLGDEGGFKQYLAVVSHAWFIPAVFGLLITPLRISTGDPQLTLNLSSFLFFLPDGYLLNVFRMLDLTQIWSSLVIAQGVHVIDRRRSFSSAAVILLTILLLMALVLARFV